MKIKNGFLMKSVAGRTIVVPVDGATLDFNGVLTLNETGAFLFSLLQKEDLSAEQLTEKITESYDIDKEIAASDVEKFIEKISEAGMIK